MKNMESMNKASTFRIWISMFFLSLCIPVFAGDSTKTKHDEFDSFIKSTQSELADSLDYYSDLQTLSSLKRDIEFQKYLAKEYSYYYTNNLNHRKNTFEWQLASSKIIFFVVVLIVLAGLVFSGLQFYHTTKQSNSFARLIDKSNVADIDKLPTPEKNEISMSVKDGLKINSSIIGLIILAISIGFFYLYILYVYPINKIDPDRFDTNKEKISNTK